jgi:hypothetical protein
MKSFNDVSMFALIALILSGCSSTLSENVKTAGLNARYSISSDGGNQATCDIVFSVGGGTGTVVELSGDDKVTCNGYATSSWKEPVSNKIHYIAGVPAQPGGNYTVTFTRKGERPYHANVALPNLIALHSPQNGDVIKKGTAIVATWVPDSDSSSDISGVLRYDLVNGNPMMILRSSPAPDSGMMTWSASDTAMDSANMGTVQARILIMRSKVGDASPGLKTSISSTLSTQINIQLVD